MRRRTGSRTLAVKWCTSALLASGVAVGAASVASACPPAATFSAFPGAAPPGGEVVVSGTAFDIGVPLRITLDSATGPLLATVVPAPYIGTMEGWFRTTVTIPVVASGFHELWAGDGQLPLPYFASSQTFQVNPLTAPGAPTGLIALPTSPTAVHLSWNAISTASGYQVLRSTGAGFSPIGAPTTTAFDDKSAAPATVYTYKVKATNGAGLSPASKPATATTPPAAPAGLITTPASPTEIHLAWNLSTGASGYDVLRSTGGSAYSTITYVTDTAYMDSGLTPATAYSYEVAAVNGGGTSPPSMSASATTMASGGAGTPPRGHDAAIGGALPPRAGVGANHARAVPPTTSTGTHTAFGSAASVRGSRDRQRETTAIGAESDSASIQGAAVPLWPGVALLIVGPICVAASAGVLAWRRRAAEGTRR